MNDLESPLFGKIDCVFKLGGSLLFTRDWPRRLRAWLASQPHGVYLGIVGGGEFVEAMREMDGMHNLSQAFVHWQCIDLLDATFACAAELTPEFDRISDWATFPRFRDRQRDPSKRIEHRVAWVRVGSFYHPRARLLIDHDSPASQPSPWPSEDWSTTTDTLSLFLAECVNAHRCVLLKSCDVQGISLQQAAEQGIVDRECLNFCERIPKIELHRL